MPFVQRLAEATHRSILVQLRVTAPAGLVIDATQRAHPGVYAVDRK